MSRRAGGTGQNRRTKREKSEGRSERQPGRVDGIQSLVFLLDGFTPDGALTPASMSGSRCRVGTSCSSAVGGQTWGTWGTWGTAGRQAPLKDGTKTPAFLC